MPHFEQTVLRKFTMNQVEDAMTGHYCTAHTYERQACERYLGAADQTLRGVKIRATKALKCAILFFHANRQQSTDIHIRKSASLLLYLFMERRLSCNA